MKLILKKTIKKILPRRLKRLLEELAEIPNYHTNPKRNSKEPPPPSTIPERLLNDFTMNGQIPVLYWYLDDRSDSVLRNSAKGYKKVFTKLENRTFKYYGKGILSFYAAFEKYSLKDKTVLI
jgi:hypothetical protein